MYVLEWKDDEYVLCVHPFEMKLGLVYKMPTYFGAVARPLSIELPTEEDARQWVEDKVRENLTQLLEARQ